MSKVWDHKKWTYISHTKANEILDYLKSITYKIVNVTADEWLRTNTGLKPLTAFTAFHKINVAKNSVEDTLQFKMCGKWYNYIINKTIVRPHDYELQKANPAIAASIFSNMVDYERYDLPVASLGQYEFPNSSEPLDPKYMKVTLHNVYGYDRHKAFLAACINLKAPLKLIEKDAFRCPKEGEVGFNGNGIPNYGPSNIVCRWIFTCGINQSLNKWAYYMVDQLNKAKTKEQIQEIKQNIVIAIGNLANREHKTNNNKFLRNCIVHRSNERTIKDKNQYTVKCNTDSVVSLVPRPDLDIGPLIGQYELEHQGDFIITDQKHYQWNTDAVKGCNDNLQARWEKANGRPFKLGVDDISEFYNYFPIKWDFKKEKYIEIEI